MDKKRRDVWDMTNAEKAEVDEIYSGAMLLKNSGLDVEAAEATISYAIKALKIQSEIYYEEMVKIRNKKDNRPDIVTLSKSATQIMKMMDELALLTQFIQGKSDSRPDMSGDVIRRRSRRKKTD